MIMHEIYDKFNFNHDAINTMLFLNLYVFYDLEQEFMPQFVKNCEEALRVVKKIELAKEEFLK